MTSIIIRIKNTTNYDNSAMPKKDNNDDIKTLVSGVKNYIIFFFVAIAIRSIFSSFCGQKNNIKTCFL